jgi:VWFA-related protein
MLRQVRQHPCRRPGRATAVVVAGAIGAAGPIPGRYNQPVMNVHVHGFWSAAAAVVLGAGLCAQTPASPDRPSQQTNAPAAQPQTKPKPPQPEKPTFVVRIDLVTNDVIVRDEKGNFVPDLRQDEFEIYEDGVKQDIRSMTVVTGGRVTNLLAPPPPPPPEGIILPVSKPVNDTSGRVFLFFVDDLHMDFHDTGRIRDLFKRIQKNLLHDGDMWGMVSSGPSSIAQDMTYDKNRFEELTHKIAGNGLKPSDIIQGPSGAEGPSEVRYRAHVAFSTVEDVLRQLEQVHNRRKALVYVSNGYDFNPFQDARLGLGDPNSPFQQNEMARQNNQMNNQTDSSGNPVQPGSDPFTQQQKQQEEFADADLARELGDITRAANRANTTFYTIDPRGLIGGSDISENLDPTQWQDYVRKSQDSLRVLAEETGGVAVVNQNDFDRALKKIDAETSDYYVLGYYSKNPDPTRRRRQIDVKVTRKGVTAWFRKEYVLKPAPPPASPTKQ